MTRLIQCWPLVVLLMALAWQSAIAEEAAAEVQALRGTVRAVSTDGKARTLSKGDPVFAGERVETKHRASVRLAFTDESRFELGANAAMNIDEYEFKPEGKRYGMKTRILRGLFRFVTGLVAKRRRTAMRVDLPVASIGIRGTYVVGKVDGNSAQVILLDQEGSETTGEIEVSNAHGSVVINQAGFGTEIPDENSPPSPPRRMALRTINNLIRNLNTLGRIRLP